MVVLQSLPTEVILQILSHLLVPDLLTLNLTSRYLRSCATSNSLWMSLCLTSWPSRPAMHEVLDLPHYLLSFSNAPRGWMRAYISVEMARKGCWLNGDDDIADTSYLLYYKSMMPDNESGDAREVARRLPPHAVFEWEQDNMVTPRTGAQFRPMKWRVSESEKIIRISAYPSIFPGRDADTWLRVLETHAFLMIGEAPEFFDSIILLDKTICEELKIKQPQPLITAIEEAIASRQVDKLQRVEDLYCIKAGEYGSEDSQEAEERRRRETEKIHAGIVAYCEQIHEPSSQVTQSQTVGSRESRQPELLSAYRRFTYELFFPLPAVVHVRPRVLRDQVIVNPSI